MSTKDKERYYLLPGMGGRARRQKVRNMLWWGVAVGLATGLLMGGFLYLMNYLSNPRF